MMTEHGINRHYGPEFLEFNSGDLATIPFGQPRKIELPPETLFCRLRYWLIVRPFRRCRAAYWRWRGLDRYQIFTLGLLRFFRHQQWLDRYWRRLFPLSPDKVCQFGKWGKVDDG